MSQISENTCAIVPDELEDSPIPYEILGNAYEQCARFHRKLQEEGQLRGLIGPRDMAIIWERHILNSAAVVPFILQVTSRVGHKTVADVGSGAGFPGLVAAAMLPDHQFTLIEPMERRILWLKECVELMGLRNVVLHHGRSQEVIDAVLDHEREAFAAVTCRAVAPMSKLAGWTIPLLVQGGSLVALKGQSAQAEIDKALKMIRKAKGTRPRVENAPVAPGLLATRVVVVDKA